MTTPCEIVQTCPESKRVQARANACKHVQTHANARKRVQTRANACTHFGGNFGQFFVMFGSILQGTRRASQTLWSGGLHYPLPKLHAGDVSCVVGGTSKHPLHRAVHALRHAGQVSRGHCGEKPALLRGTPACCTRLSGISVE